MQINLSLPAKIFILFFWITFGFSKLFAGPQPEIHQTSKPSWLAAPQEYNKKPSGRNVSNGAYDELFEEQINVAENATYIHTITVIVSASGVQNNSEISVSFDPSYQRVNFHEITVWRNNQPQNRLNINEFKILADEREFEKFIYDGTYDAKYILADIRKGDRIEYSYTITGLNPIFNNKFSRNIYLQGADFIMHQFTTLLYPTARKLSFKSFNVLSAPKISVIGPLTRYQWEDYQVPGVTTSKFEAKWINNYARVQVSEFSSWADVVDWGMRINPLQTSFTGELADSVNSLKRRFGNDKERYFRAAVTIVQDEVRYMGIETGPYSHKANAPDKVFKQRYGDCKDKSLLLASILNAGGIEAHMALLNTDYLDKIALNNPSPVLFDHAVVVANVNGKEVWVDATMSNQGGKGTAIYFPPYLKALVLKAGNNGLTSIGESKAGKIAVIEKYKIIDEFLPVSFEVVTIYTLNEADQVRDDIATTGVAQTEKNYLDYYSKTYSKVEAADSLKIIDDQSKNQLTTIESYKISNFFKTDSASGNKYSAEFYASEISRQLPDIDSRLKTPVAVNYPYNMDYTIKVTMPYGWDIADENTEITRGAYKFSLNKKVDGDDLLLQYKFSYLKNNIPAAELPQYVKDLKNLKDDQLSYSFYYIPDIKKVPFKLNHMMVLLTIAIICICAWLGLRIFKNETAGPRYFGRSPVLGGWLILLAVVLVCTPLGIINILFESDFYSVTKWEMLQSGTLGIMHKILVTFELAVNILLICFSIFCFILVLKKRDIAPFFLKTFFLISVAFLFLDYFFKGMVNNNFSDYGIWQIIKTIIAVSLWTYYLNVSERVKETFIVPYRKELLDDI